MIYPVFDDPDQVASSINDVKLAFLNTAIQVDRLNPKYNCPIFTDKLFTYGTTFQYKNEDKKGIVYQDIPTNYCRVSYIEDGVFRFQIDVSKLNEKLAMIFPKEIQTAYTSYQNGNTSQLLDGKWYQVSDKGAAFTIDPDVLANGGYSIPPFANALIDGIKSENAKTNMEDADTLDNTKIIHSEVPLDNKGRPTMDFGIVDKYQGTLKKHLPDGAVAITNPFKTQALTLNGTGKDGKFALLDKSQSQIYTSAGVSAQLFANDGQSSNALEKSLTVDTQLLYNYLLPMYTNYYNYELRKTSKKSTLWKTKFVEISHFDKDQVIKTYKEVLTFGGSRLEYLACCGMTPLEVANVLIFEQQVLSIDDFMVAKQTSNTLGADSEETGRPELKNPTDTTQRIKDSE
jgi:hypothetical protein